MARRNDVLSAILRQDFLAFLRKVFEHLNPGQEFKDNWHLAAVAYALTRIAAGADTRLVVNMPPRSLKSITVSVAWVAWRLGVDPTLRFICVSYSSELSLKLARDCRDIMQSDWYRRAFPTTVLERAVEHDLVTTRGGGRFSTSVGGTLTGRGGDFIIIDDPMKADEAMSETARRNLEEWFSNTLLSRLNDKVKGAIILVMQRLHAEDLSAHMLRVFGCPHLKLAAIAEEDEYIEVGPEVFKKRAVGDLLHPTHEPLYILEQMRSSMGSMTFAAQYQQAPLPDEGAMFKRPWLKRYDALSEGGRIVQSWDCASKAGLTNDYSVCITALVKGRNVYVIDVFRQRLEFPALRDTSIGLARRYKPHVLLIEDAAAGTQLIQELQSLNHPDVQLPIAIHAEKDKKTRAFGHTGMVQSGGLFLPHEAPWLTAFEAELTSFPQSKHDDQVDALSQLLEWLRGDAAFDIPSVMPYFGENPEPWVGSARPGPYDTDFIREPFP